MATNMRADEWQSWEVDPSTRTAVHPYTKYAPIADTLSTTAEDVFTLDRGTPSINLVTNPRLGAADISMFVAEGLSTAPVRSTTSPALGTHALEVSTANSTKGEGVYWVTPSLVGHPEGSYLVASCEVRAASGTSSVAISVTDSDGVELVASPATALSTSWQRIFIVYHLPVHSPATYRVKVSTSSQANQDFFIDKFHVEPRKDGVAPAYVDGSVTSVSGEQYEWLGTANASESRRRPGMSVIRGLRVTNEHATIKVYIAFDEDATATTGIPIAGGETWETNWPIDFRTKVSAIAASGTPAIHGVVWGIHQG